MANYNTSATVTLSVNGKQAQQMLKRLQNEAATLEKKISKAATAGDKATMSKLQKELRQTNGLIQQLQSSAKTAEQVLARMDRATPRELNKTLRTLQSQLNGIQRGTPRGMRSLPKSRPLKPKSPKSTRRWLSDRPGGNASTTGSTTARRRYWALSPQLRGW